MDHYVVDNTHDFVQQKQPHAQRREAPDHTECEEFVEAIMIDDRRKSCARTTMDDVGYLCGCGVSPIDDAEVVYVKRSNATPKNANLSDQREDISTGRFSANVLSPRLNRDHREEGFEANPEDLLYSSPRVGCMTSGVIDLFTPGCGLKPRATYNENRASENIAALSNSNEKGENSERHNTKKNVCDDKNENYNEWKKHMLDTVKAPSFNTIEVELTSEHSNKKDSTGVSDIPFKYQCQSPHQWQENERRNTPFASDPPDSKANKHYASSLNDDYELNQLRSEHLSLRKTREELQSELETAKRYNRAMFKKTSALTPRGDSSVLSLDDVHRMQINQKFDDVMRMASPRSSIDRASSMDMMMANRHYISPRSSSTNWNGGATSPTGLSHLPSFPLGISGSYTINSPSNVGHLGFHPQLMSPFTARENNNNQFHRDSLNVNSNFAKSPASMMSGINDQSCHYGHASAASCGWGENHEGQPWKNSSIGHLMSNERVTEPPYYSERKKYQGEEELLNEMRMRSAAMEQDIMRIRGASQNFQPNNLHSPERMYNSRSFL